MDAKDMVDFLTATLTPLIAEIVTSSRKGNKLRRKWPRVGSPNERH